MSEIIIEEDVGLDIAQILEPSAIYNPANKNLLSQKEDKICYKCKKCDIQSVKKSSSAHSEISSNAQKIKKWRSSFSSVSTVTSTSMSVQDLEDIKSKAREKLKIKSSDLHFPKATTGNSYSRIEDEFRRELLTHLNRGPVDSSIKPKVRRRSKMRNAKIFLEIESAILVLDSLAETVEVNVEVYRSNIVITSLSDGKIHCDILSSEIQSVLLVEEFLNVLEIELSGGKLIRIILPGDDIRDAFMKTLEFLKRRYKSSNNFRPLFRPVLALSRRQFQFPSFDTKDRNFHHSESGHSKTRRFCRFFPLANYEKLADEKGRNSGDGRIVSSVGVMYKELDDILDGSSSDRWKVGEFYIGDSRKDLILVEESDELECFEVSESFTEEFDQEISKTWKLTDRLQLSSLERPRPNILELKFPWETLILSFADKVERNLFRKTIEEIIREDFKGGSKDKGIELDWKRPKCALISRGENRLKIFQLSDGEIRLIDQIEISGFALSETSQSVQMENRRFHFNAKDICREFVETIQL